MELVLAGAFGSLPEATIVFSSLKAAGFNPVAAFNMNTPGAANGMAPSAYRVLVPEAEGQAAQEFLAEFARGPSNGENRTDILTDHEDIEDRSTDAVLRRARPIARFFAAGILLAWLAIACLMLLRR